MSVHSGFWHQLLRQLLTGLASVLAHGIVKLPKGGLSTRYAKIFLAFLISGLLHTAADVAGGMPLVDSGTIRFFCTQALGIAVEDGVVATYQAFWVYFTGKRTNVCPLWAQTIGYCWVVMYLFWSTPAWVYPLVVRSQASSEERLLPFSIVEKFMLSKAG